MSEVAENRDEFIIDDDEKAEWAINKIREAKEDISTWETHYANQLQKIKDEANRTIEIMEAKLFHYFQTVPHKKAAKSESYRLKSGKLVLKRQEPEYEHNDDVLIPWLEANMPELVKVKKSSDWSGLKERIAFLDGKAFDENGEEIPGVTFTEREDIFKVEGI